MHFHMKTLEGMNKRLRHRFEKENAELKLIKRWKVFYKMTFAPIFPSLHLLEVTLLLSLSKILVTLPKAGSFGY